MKDDEVFDKLKLSLRLDSDEDDNLLRLYIDTAKGFIYGAIGRDEDYKSFFEIEEVKAMLTTAVIAQATGYYNARTSITSIPMSPVNLAVNSIIGQIRYRYDSFMEEQANEN
ncbi:phage QLRG family DNA packaging [Weissella oryzae SG25]|uniref:Phage QLRG family DNA packaging n=1 Tax=Weissella oryzae (strain DSM 25784 / JCM 18191 / LMG 30913 / SG25) TaxID=1329250 RepID=A0A069CX60_WEIOS|nr:head-tail connector protein [Weissella oryzae]GAK31967.1 phage QLRG family DNA packaging [Weissella oryzae SG25]